MVELYIHLYIVSSPYLLVFGDDRVIRYKRVDDVTGGVAEAQHRSRAN